MKKIQDDDIKLVYRIDAERAKRLKNKALDMTAQRRKIVKESDLVRILIDEFLDKIDVTMVK